MRAKKLKKSGVPADKRALFDKLRYAVKFSAD
jgi:hypothetical protein